MKMYSSIYTRLITPSSTLSVPRAPVLKQKISNIAHAQSGIMIFSASSMNLL